MSETWPVYSPFAKEHYGRGKEEGRVEGKAEALLTVLAIRGIEVPETARSRIRASADLDEIGAWIRRAAVAGSVDEVFG